MSCVVDWRVRLNRLDLHDDKSFDNQIELER